MSAARGAVAAAAEVAVDAQRFPRTAALLAEIRAEFPDFRLLPKQGDTLQTQIGRCLRLVTLGRMRTYSSEYHTVMFGALWLPEAWHTLSDNTRYILLRHERVHLRQRRRYGDLLMAALYIFPFVPLGLAYGRARIEWEAYEETIAATLEVYGLGAACALEEELVQRFCGADYGWMWPFPRTIRAWFASALDRVVASAPP